MRIAATHQIRLPWNPCTTDPALHFRHIGNAGALIGYGQFRPPYGHLRPSAHSAARYLQKQDQLDTTCLSAPWDACITSRPTCVPAPSSSCTTTSWAPLWTPEMRQVQKEAALPTGRQAGEASRRSIAPAT
jgi:hypothetical protein